MKRLVLCILFSIWATASFGQSVHYIVAMPQPASHVFHVEMTIDAPPAGPLDLALPAWNGLYQIRDFAQFVENMKSNAPIHRMDKDTWRFDVKNIPQLKVEYGVYADELSSFASQLDESHGFFNAADLLLLWIGHRDLPVEMTVEPPQGWTVVTSLPRKGTSNAYRADNYDHLVDCPVDAGKLDQYGFSVDGKEFRISVDGDHRSYDKNELTSMVERIARAEISFMKDAPFDHYNFIYHFNNSNQGGGGMEHRDSTAIHVSMAPSNRSLRDVAGVSAHEFFHLWNVKRIRPQGLQRVDYFKENYTTALWFCEGVTSYYGDLFLERSGLMSRSDYLASLTEEIRTLQSRPGRKTLSVADASLLTWFDKYPFFRQPDQSISYYNKGLLIGLLLDLKIRDATDNKSSLDTVMRYLNDNFAKKNRFFEDDYGIAKAITAATGVNLDEEYQAFVHTTAELPYADFLRLAGLELAGNRIREMASPTPKQRRILESWLTGN